MSVRVQETVGRYRIEELLGAGDSFEVFRAYDPQMDRPVAVRRVLRSRVSAPAFVNRFLQEARLVAALDHPGVMRIYDFDEEEGVPYLVMPFFEGGTLRDRLREGACGPAQIVAWIRQIAGALDTAHRWGILHRDVKPTRVFMNEKDEPVLGGFGLARIPGAAELRSSDVIIDTPTYMAPEIVQGAPATAAGDLYALAVMAQEMLCGERPSALDEVLRLALDKDPNCRPLLCEAWSEKLARVLEAPVAREEANGMLWSADNARLGSEMIRTPEIVESLATPTEAKSKRKTAGSGRGWWIVAALIGVALLLGAFGLGR